MQNFTPKFAIFSSLLVYNLISSVIPVNELSPKHIKVVCAMGDSMTVSTQTTHTQGVILLPMYTQLNWHANTLPTCTLWFCTEAGSGSETSLSTYLYQCCTFGTVHVLNEVWE